MIGRMTPRISTAAARALREGIQDARRDLKRRHDVVPDQSGLTRHTRLWAAAYVRTKLNEAQRTRARAEASRAAAARRLERRA
jgi:hypothetical protein